MPERNGSAIPFGLWWWPLPLFLLAAYGARLHGDDTYQRWINSELGIIELATPALLIAAVVFGVQCWRRRAALPRRGLAPWFLLVTLACVYIAGEEVSWGQHLFGWDTPESIAALNDQGETNLHNISSWFDQKPRLLLELWVLAGGILLPAWNALRRRRYNPAGWRWWFWPPAVCIPAAVFAIAIRMPERIKDWFGLGPFSVEIRYSELQELYFAFFLLFYLWANASRLTAKQSP